MYTHYCSKVWAQFFLLKEINTFIQQGCITLIKSDSKTFIKCYNIYIFKEIFCIMLFKSQKKKSNKCYSIKLFIKESWTNILVAAKIFGSTTVFNIINNRKCFLKTEPDWFLKDRVILKTGVMMQIQLCHTGKYIFFKYISSFKSQ